MSVTAIFIFYNLFPLCVNNNAINVHFLGLNMIMALKIAEKTLASLGPFSTILWAIIMLIPRK